MVSLPVENCPNMAKVFFALFRLFSRQFSLKKCSVSLSHANILHTWSPSNIPSCIIRILPSLHSGFKSSLFLGEFDLNCKGLRDLQMKEKTLGPILRGTLSFTDKRCSPRLPKLPRQQKTKHRRSHKYKCR